MTEWDIEVAKFGDPLLDPSSRKSDCYCLVDREHRNVILGIADPRFAALKEETRMLWLRKFGVVSNVMDEAFKFPDAVEELEGQIEPPQIYSPTKEIVLSLKKQESRDDIAWLARALWRLLEIDELPEETKRLFFISWSNSTNEKFKSEIRQFLNRPKVVEIREKQKEEAQKAFATPTSETTIEDPKMEEKPQSIDKQSQPDKPA